jgi:hypothetical protein
MERHSHGHFGLAKVKKGQHVGRSCFGIAMTLDALVIQAKLRLAWICLLEQEVAEFEAWIAYCL